MPVEATVVLSRLVDFLEDGDPSALDDVLAPGAVVWHNDDGVEMPAPDALSRIGALHDLVEGVNVDVVREEAITGGTVAQIEIRGTVRASGSPFRARNCVLLTVDDGRLARIDEYVDPTIAAQLGVGEPTARPSEVRSTVDRYVDLRARLDRGEGEWTELAGFFTEDAVFVDPAWGRIEGRDAIVHLFTEAMAGIDFTYPIDMTAVAGDWVVVKGRQVLPGKRPDGRPWQQTFVTTLLYAGDGRFRYEEDVLNMTQAVEDIVASGWQPGPGFTAPPAAPDRDADPEPRSRISGDEGAQR